MNKITLLHQVGISNYFMRKMHGQTTLNLWYMNRVQIGLGSKDRAWETVMVLNRGGTMEKVTGTRILCTDVQ